MKYPSILPSRRWWLLALFMALPSLALAQYVAAPTDLQVAPPNPAVDALRFTEWANLATMVTISPARIEPGDLTKRWKGADGRDIQLVVKRPHPKPDAPTVTMAAVPDGTDARPAFDAAMAEVRAKGAGKLVIPPGVYQFMSVAKPGNGMAQIEGVTDLTIDGRGATFVAGMNLPAIFVTQSKRVAVMGLTLDSGLHIMSSGTIVQRADQSTVLVIDPEYPVTEKDTVAYVVEYDVSAGKWVQGGQVLMVDPGAPQNAAIYIGAQTYIAASFKTIRPGTRVLVSHYWYGHALFRINDAPGANQTEDVVIDGVTFRSSPGFGVYAYGMKRGLAIINSTIAAKPNSRLPVSTAYDAIHIIGGAGDIQIAGNRIANHNDDSINLDSAVSPIVSISADGLTLRLAKHSRLIAPDDVLAFFDRSGRFLGRATVVAKPKPLGYPDSEVVIDRAVAGVAPLGIVRSLSNVSSRFDVSKNVIEDCACHALVAQLPNGIAETNVIRNIVGNAIRLRVDVATWNEGVGAFNVIVRGNQISNTGTDRALKAPWAAITAYGGALGTVAYPLNKDLEISGNVIADAKQGCISIANSIDVKVVGNRCNGTNLGEQGKPSLNVQDSSNVVLLGNRRTGDSTGGLNIKATPPAVVVPQADY